MRISSCSTLNELGDAISNAAKAMTLVSNKLDTKKLSQMAKVLAKEDMKLDMKSEMMEENGYKYQFFEYKRKRVK